MKAVLICPSERPALSAFAPKAPFVLLPILGRNLLHYWLAQLTTLGVKQVLLLASDRPDAIRGYVGTGARWGLQVEVIPETHELTVEEARAKYRVGEDQDWLAHHHDVILLDHLPCLSKQPLSESYAQWFQTVLAWVQYAQTPDRIGVREISPGVWAGLRAHISPSAELNAPCWIGEDAHIGPHAVIGPMAIIEDRAFVDNGALVSHSWIGSDTYTGEFTALMNSLAWGDCLINWELGSSMRVSDAFLLCSLRGSEPGKPRVSWLSRVAAQFVLLATLPFGLLAISKALVRNQQPLRRRTGVCPAGSESEKFVYHELTHASAWFARWPQIWNILRGEMDWVGNRPLTGSEAADLVTDFDKRWLACPPGLVSLADTKGCMDEFSDEARAHAAFYTATKNIYLNTSILADAAAAWMLGEPSPRFSERVTISLRSLLAAGERIHLWNLKT